MALLGVGFLSVSCATGNVEPFSSRPAEIRSLSAVEQQLRHAASESPDITVHSIGSVEYGAFTAPIFMVSFRPGLRARVLVTAGVHGNEPAGVEYALSLIGRLAEDDLSGLEFGIDVVPIVNPWGWAHDIRYNADGMDINRDFASLDTQEARIVLDATATQSYDLVVDHHEDPDASGVYFYQYGQRSKALIRELIEIIRSDGFPIETDVNMIILKTRDGLIDAPLWGLRYMRLTGQLSITNFYRLAGNRHVYTVETPVTLPMEKRVQVHETAFSYLLRRVVQQE